MILNNTKHFSNLLATDVTIKSCTSENSSTYRKNDDILNRISAKR